MTECDPPEFCDEENVEFEVNYDANRENIYNWYTTLNLGCIKKLQTSLIAISCMFGIWVGVLFVPRMGDLYGRKPVFCASLTLQVLPYVFMALSSRLWVIYLAAFVFGFCIIGRMSAGFLLLMELVHSRNQARVGAALMVAEGSA